MRESEEKGGPAPAAEPRASSAPAASAGPPEPGPPVADAGEAATQAPGTSRSFSTGMQLPQEAQDRLALFVVRAMFFLAAAGLGLAGARVIGTITLREDLDPKMGVIIGCSTAAVIILLDILYSRNPIRTLAAITFGLLIGLALSLIFQFVIEFIVNALTSPAFRVSHGPTLLPFLQVLTTTIFCYFGVTMLLRTKDDFKFIIPYVEFRKEVRRSAPLILDTSAFVDGRIQALLATGVFDQRLVVPKFVITELQTVADSSDRSLRERGRRGLDMLGEIERTYKLEFVDHPRGPGQSVDGALLGLANLVGGKVVSTDFNLEKNARLQGIPFVNINDLATALKPTFVPGESLTVRLLREGDDKGQAVGFLKDGTMVVVENARHMIGQDAQVEVTSSLQTSAGKMAFGRLRAPRRKGGEG